MNKRCYSTAEAITYLGIKRRSFESHILPKLKGKGVRIGNCIVFEVTDLDQAWDSYKMDVGSERPDTPKGDIKWDAPRRPVSRKADPVMTLTRSTKAIDFASAASKVLKQPRPG